jgi:hypothetical protein
MGQAWPPKRLPRFSFAAGQGQKLEIGKSVDKAERQPGNER